MKFEKKMAKVSTEADSVPVPVATSVVVPSSTGLSREELQAKLKAKMESFKTKRGAEAPKNKKQLQEKKDRREKKLAIKKAQKETFGQKIDLKKQAQAAAILDGGRQIFSKFDFGLEKGKKAVTPKNPKQALQKVESRLAKIQKLTTEDKSKAEQLQKSEAWAKAIQKAQGLVIKDDPKLLKKSIHRLEKAKEKRTEKWNERKQETKDLQFNKQKKRQENLDKRKEQAKIKKFGTSGVKKRPGFEGGHFKKVQKRK